MNFDWVMAPVTQGAILAAGLLGSLTMWIGVKSEIRVSRKALEALRNSTEATIRDLSAQIQELRTEAARDVPAAPAQFQPVPGLNLTQRTKVLRMSRRGETSSSIAAALGIQHEEVDLLLKVDRMLATRFDCQ